MLISLGMDLAAAVKVEDLISAVGHLFHHHPTYSDLHIAQRITEDYHIKLSVHQVKRIRLQNNWLRRHNNPTSNEAQDQEASTFDAVEQLLAEGHIYQYGYR